MKIFYRMLQESREPSSSHKKILTPLPFLEEKLRNAGNLLKQLSKKRKKPGRSSKVLRMKSPNFIRLSSKDQDFLLVKTTQYTSS